ncbi:hypothetical protein DPEC_G00291590 [Dallia pectoralis]|uniref:Uncharacterized protein n=1 Tax=Dallia pectoralis TaxID=75939 RepID=A0ACC2FI21_DALPE|nr:hypothetical protein DPEC_G00291590 [Dallia pectoralis]
MGSRSRGLLRCLSRLAPGRFWKPRPQLSWQCLAGARPSRYTRKPRTVSCFPLSRRPVVPEDDVEVPGGAGHLPPSADTGGETEEVTPRKRAVSHDSCGRKHLSRTRVELDNREKLQHVKRKEARQGGGAAVDIASDDSPQLHTRKEVKFEEAHMHGNKQQTGKLSSGRCLAPGGPSPSCPAVHPGPLPGVALIILLNGSLQPQAGPREGDK